MKTRFNPNGSNRLSGIESFDPEKAKLVAENPLAHGNECLFKLDQNQYLLIRNERYFQGKRVGCRSDEWLRSVQNNPKAKRHLEWKETRFPMTELEAMQWALGDCIELTIPADFQEKATTCIRLMYGCSGDLLDRLAKVSKRLKVPAHEMIKQAIESYITAAENDTRFASAIVEEANAITGTSAV